MLHSDKTFIDQGVENGAEIVITGGRLWILIDQTADRKVTVMRGYFIASYKYDCDDMMTWYKVHSYSMLTTILIDNNDDSYIIQIILYHLNLNILSAAAIVEVRSTSMRTISYQNYEMWWTSYYESRASYELASYTAYVLHTYRQRNTDAQAATTRSLCR
jgi:hypothetical protein